MKSLMVVCAVFITAAAFADKVVLKSGSFLTGTVGAVKNGELTFVSEDLGEVTIKVENIASLENAGMHEVLFKDGSAVSNAFSVADGKYVVNAAPLDMAKVKEIDPTPETWHGSVHLAYQAARGNTYENSGSVMAHLDRRWEKDRLNVDFGYYYSETGTGDTDTKKTTDRWEAEVKHDHFWLPKVYHYEDIRYDRDVIQDLNARYRAGLGAGYQWLEKTPFESTGAWSFNQELGVNWIKEEYSVDNPDAKDSGFCALRYAHHLGYVPVWTDNLEFFHNFKILPDVSQWEKFIAKADLGVQAKLVYNWTLDARIEWDYDSKPAEDMKKDDFRYIVGLGYKW